MANTCGAHMVTAPASEGVRPVKPLVIGQKGETHKRATSGGRLAEGSVAIGLASASCLKVLVSLKGPSSRG